LLPRVYANVPFQLVVQRGNKEFVYQSKSILREVKEEKEEGEDLKTRDVLDVLIRYSLENNPPLRFLSTNDSDEVIAVDHWKNTWTSRWKVFLEERLIDPKDLRKGVKMKAIEKIRLVYVDTPSQISRENTLQVPQ